MLFIRFLAVIGFALCAGVVQAADGSWFVRPYGGFSQLSDTSGDRIDTVTQGVDIEIDGGFLAGLGVGYRFNDRWAAELAWEYRSNDSETRYADGTFFDDGNYASNVFYLNGYYYFPASGAWQPYVGAGLGWVQEIDIDLEGFGPEQSFSGDGDFTAQVIAGIDYALKDNWSAHVELRYAWLSGVDLDAESATSGSIDGLDYNPFTVAAGLTWRF